MRYLLNMVFLMGCYASAALSELNMPEELVEHARNNDCQPLTDFYTNHPGMINPPFAYGYLDEVAMEDSAVYWCEKRGGGGTSSRGEWYLNIYLRSYLSHNVYLKNPVTSTYCNSHIRVEHPPGGLSILRDMEMSLDKFVYIDLPHGHLEKRQMERPVVARSPLIKSHYEGVVGYFYCDQNQGRWLFKEVLIRDRDDAVPAGSEN